MKKHFRFRYSCLATLILPLLVTSVSAKTVTLTAVDNNTSICLVEGDTLVIQLRSPIPNAYRWKAYLDKGAPLTAMREFEAPGAGKDAQVQSFRFNAAAVGETRLTLRFELTAVPDVPRQPPQEFAVNVAVASGAPKSGILLGTYQGTTACADCTGIRTDLRLYAKGKNDFTDTIFVMTRTYQGGRLGDQSFTDRGEWAVLKGDAVDPNATVYALNPDDPAKRQYWLLQPGGSTLTGLDRDQKPIEAPPIYQSILKRVE